MSVPWSLLQAPPWVPVYGDTKAYVLNLTQRLKQQLGETNIRFQYVAPALTASEIWDVMGVPLASFYAVLMDTEACVDAALAGLDAGEFIAAASVHNGNLVAKFEEASTTLLAASQTSELRFAEAGPPPVSDPSFPVV